MKNMKNKRTQKQIKQKKQKIKTKTKIQQKETVKRLPSVEDWNEAKTMSFITGLCKAFGQYKSKFRGFKGLDLLQVDDKKLLQMGLAKLHRLKLLVELAKKTDAEHSVIFDDIESTSVLNWDSKRVRKWAAKVPSISNYALNFQRHGVDGMLLFELDDEDLDTIGVRAIHKKKFFDAIDELHRISFPNAPPLVRKRKSNSQLV